MSTFKNIAIAGASGGSLGPVLLQRLTSDPAFTVTVLKRQGSKSTFPSSVTVKEVDYSSVSSLQAALTGVDAVVSVLGATGLETQINLVDAAIAAGVQRFLPSEYGCDLENPKARKLPVFADKVKVEDYITEKAKTTNLTYTFVYNNAFLDWGLRQHFLLDTSKYKPAILIGHADNEFSITTLASVAQAIAGILKHPQETKNRAVRIYDSITTQNKLLALAKKAAPAKDWEPVPVKLDDMTAKADAKLAKGVFDTEVVVAYLHRGIFDSSYGSKFENTDNELLGVKGVTDDDIIEMFKSIIP